MSIGDLLALDVHWRVSARALDEAPLPGKAGPLRLPKDVSGENRFCRGALTVAGSQRLARLSRPPDNRGRPKRGRVSHDRLDFEPLLDELHIQRSLASSNTPARSRSNSSHLGILIGGGLRAYLAEHHAWLAAHR